MQVGPRIFHPAQDEGLGTGGLQFYLDFGDLVLRDQFDVVLGRLETRSILIMVAYSEFHLLVVLAGD